MKILNAMSLLVLVCIFSITANAEKISKNIVECTYQSISSTNQNGIITKNEFLQTFTSNNTSRTNDNGVSAVIDSTGDTTILRNTFGDDGNNSTNYSMQFAYVKQTERSTTDLGNNRFYQLSLAAGLRTAKEGFSFKKPDGTSSKTQEIKTKIETVYFDDGVNYKQESLKVNDVLQLDEGNYSTVETEENGWYITTETLMAPYSPSDDPETTIETSVSICKSKRVQ